MLIYNLFKIAVDKRFTLCRSIINIAKNIRNNAQHYPSLRQFYMIIDPLALVARYGNEIESTLNADCKRRKETLNTVVERTNMINERNP